MAPSDADPFGKAFQLFLTSLPQEEQKRYSPCASVDDLLEGFRKLKGLTEKWQGKRFSRVTSTLKSLSDRLQPFFACVDVFVQASPKYGALIWGSIRVLLTLSSNFSSFFEKLLSIFDTISRSFPQFKDAAALCKLPDVGRLQGLVEGVFASMLSFFQDVANIFTNNNSKLRSTTGVVLNLIWTPVDVRFRNFTVNLNRYQQSIRDELQIEQFKTERKLEEAARLETQAAARERSNAEKARSELEETSNGLRDHFRETKFFSVHEWINPPNHADALDRALDLQSPGTCNWVYEDPAFQAWRTSTNIIPADSATEFGSNTLWIHGKPGAGKTVLAASLIQEMRQSMIKHATDGVVCYYFFSSQISDRSNVCPEAAYRSILSQILYQYRHNTEVLDIFLFAWMRSTIGQLCASSSELIGLLELLLPSLPSACIIVDGIDECSDEEALTRTMRTLLKSQNIKALFSSRPNVSRLARGVDKSQRCVFDAEVTSGDIKTYFASEISSMMEERLLPKLDPTKLIWRLVRGADGMFLWAALMIKYLNSPAMTPQLRLRVINEIVHPEGLDQMYNRIFSAIEMAGSLQTALARRIFCWLVYAITPLCVQHFYSVAQLTSGLELGHGMLLSHDIELTQDMQSEGDPDKGGQSATDEFGDSLIQSCGSLVELYPLLTASRQPTGRCSTHRVRLVHLSLREYLQNLGSTNLGTVATPAIVKSIRQAVLGHSTLCCDSLFALMHLPAHSLAATGCLKEYAVRFWTTHLLHLSEKTTSSNLLSNHTTSHEDQLSETLRKFLDSPISISGWLAKAYQLEHIYHQNPLYGVHGSWDIGIHDLMKVARWFCEIKPHTQLTSHHRTLVHDFADFANDIQQLTREWGKRLISDSALIWDDVPAFSKSRFLQKSLPKTEVTYFQPKSLNEMTCTQSTKPLSIVSATSQDGEITCTLSIWPPKEYEQRWQDGRKDMFEICDGWIASYEVWSVTSKARVASLKFCLEANEARLQMQQSLYRHDQDALRTAFPTAISPDLKSIVILRMLYSVDAESISSGRPTYKSAIIPIEAISKPAWEIKETPSRDSDLPSEQRVPRYVYAISFSPGGQYLSFLASEMKKDRLGIFKISKSDKISVELVNSMICSSFSLDASSSVLAFHPTKEAIVFFSLISIRIWVFSKGSESPPVVLASLERILLEPKLSISDCGTYIVASSHNNAPIVLQIPTALLTFNKGTNGDTFEAVGDGIDDRRTLSQIGNAATADFRIRPGQVMTNTSLIKNSENLTLIDVRGGESASIRLIRTNETDVQSLEIVSLPKVEHAKHIAPTVVAPNHAGGRLRVLLNPKSSTQYSMDSSHTVPVPALVEKDAELVRLQISANTGNRIEQQLSTKQSLNPQVTEWAWPPLEKRKFESITNYGDASVDTKRFRPS